MIDLKIAEALGIPKSDDDEGLEEGILKHGSRYYYYPAGSEDWCFEWSLTGPDAGNTMLVIMEAMEKDWFIQITATKVKPKYSCVLDNHGFQESIYVREYADTAPLALRKAAAKALKVEVGG